MAKEANDTKDSKAAKDKPKLVNRLIGITSRTIWLGFIVLIVMAPLYVYSVKINMFGLFGEFPDLKLLENPRSSLASVMYFSDGAEAGKYFRENRNRVIYEDLSPHLVHALKATEDIRFEDHSGIDLRALLRAAKGVLTNNLDGGGSTLTQQLAKNLFKTREEKFNGTLSEKNRYLKIIIEKTKEMILAVRLEQAYSKKEIMAMYLNTVEFGSNAYGVKVASETFFNKPVDSLNIQEAAVLAGVVQAPTRLSPVYNYDNSLHRRNVVLKQMQKYAYINQQEYDSLKELVIDLKYSVASHNKGPATYFRSQARNFLMDWCKKNDYDLWADGLRIYTTIDSKMQIYAESAVKEHMKELQNTFVTTLKGKEPWIDDKGRPIKNYVETAIKKTETYRNLVKRYGPDSDSLKYYLYDNKKKMKVFSWEGEIDTTMSPVDSLKYYKHFLHAGFMVMDPNTGHIKAWVGGINHKHFQFDHVKQGTRQPGSTFKAFLYATAIDAGYSPCFQITDAPITFKMPSGDEWSPENSDDDFEGQTMTIRQAMGRSMNRVAAYIINRVGPESVANLAHKMGINSPLAPVPSLCLGTSDVSLYELVGGYSTFVNEGVWTEPYYITRIEDKNGNVLQSFTPKRKEALNEEVAYVMLHMLRGATEEEGGTARGLGYDLLHENEIGAKTGTTQNASDGWFVGVTKDLVAGAWVGGDERSIHFRSWVYGQGARTAMPIYKKFMKQVYSDKSLNITKGAFKRPIKRLSVELDCDKHLYQGYDETDSLTDNNLYDNPLSEEEIE